MFKVMAATPAAESVIVCGSFDIPARLIAIITVPAVTLETVNVRNVPLPDKLPDKADPVPGIMSMAHCDIVPGSELNTKLMAVVVGLPIGVAVQVIGAETHTDCGAAATPG